MSKKNILIVDDSALMRRLVSDIIESDGRFVVADTVSNGLEAFNLVTLNPKKYDAIILDIHMPKMNGIEFLESLERIRLKQNIIVVSTVAKEGAKETIRCLELGVFDFVTKPESYIKAREQSFQDRLLSVLAIATGLDSPISSYRTVRPVSKNDNVVEKRLYRPSNEKIEKHPFKKTGRAGKKLIALTCSTGGPKALQQVVPLLPENIDAPMILVQHMPVGFTNSLAQRLNEYSKLTVKEAEEGDVLQNGYVYVAKGGSHMRVVKKFGGHRLTLTDEPPRGGLRPCADIMFESLVQCDYDEIICIVLTGVGGDGTNGIKQLNGVKNIYVISQDEATSTVYGMPKVIYESGLSDEVVPLEKVADAITKITGVR